MGDAFQRWMALLVVVVVPPVVVVVVVGGGRMRISIMHMKIHRYVAEGLR